MNDNDKYVVRAGSTAHDLYETDLSSERAGLDWGSMRVLGLPAGASQEVETGEDEILVMPLSGSCIVEVDGESYELDGRAEVWTAITDYLYVPRRTRMVVSSREGGRFALPGSTATRDLPVRYCPASEVDTTLRGTGHMSRQVDNYALGNRLETSHLLVCEVLTPGGNWSSYPPHKHDEHRDDERILRRSTTRGPARSQRKHGMAIQRVYPSGHQIDICAQVGSRDMVVMPFDTTGRQSRRPVTTSTI